MSKKIISSAYIKIPLELMKPETQEKIMEELTFYYKDYQSGDIVEIKFYKKDETALYTPRYFFDYYDQIKLPENIIIKKHSPGDKIQIQDSIKLKNKIQQDSVDALKSIKHGSLKLPPGKGKTVIAIKFISWLKRKTLIIVDSEKLKNQWIERITQFTNLKDENIGTIQGSKWITDKPIIIGMIQTISSRCDKKGFHHVFNLLKDINIGCTIFDEAHVIIGPEKFTVISFSLPCDRIYGLSATLYRTDNREMLFKYCIGDIVYSSDEYEIFPKVNAIHIDTGIFSTKVGWVIRYGNKFNRSLYIKILKKNTMYLDVIDSIMNACYENKRQVVLISEPIFLLEFFIDKYKDDSRYKNKMGLFIGGTDDSEKDFQFVFTTYKLTGKAIDQPIWDTMVFLTPMASPITVEQSIGRITRSYPGKKSAVVFDIIDISFPNTKKWFQSRLEFYNKLNLQVNQINKI